jgi:hypothetical protein
MRPEERRRQARREAYLETLGPRERARAEDFSVYSDIPGFNLLPTNIKAYIQSQLGLGGLGGPITELDLTEKELAELDRMIFEAGLLNPGEINYIDYSADIGKVARPGSVESVAEAKNVTPEYVKANPDKIKITAPNGQVMTIAELYQTYGENALTPVGLTPADFLDPSFNLMTFLGSADVTQDADGNYIINDVFDFNKPIEGKKDSAQGLGANPLYEIARKIPDYNPIATDIPVEIDLGTREDYEGRKNMGMANGGMPLIELKYDL